MVLQHDVARKSLKNVGKEISVKTLQIIAVVAALIATAMTGTTARAAGAPSVDAPLLGADGQPMTLGQMAMKFAAHLTPPFVTTDPARAIDYLRGVGEGSLQRPLSPIGGWGDGSRPATLGDLTVILVQQFKIEATSSTPGAPPSAQDYQTALLSYAGSVNTTTFTGMQSLFQDWVSDSLSPLGPVPGEKKTS
ncbi:MAG: hypothetical protein NTY01_00625 [Verrucomicrobia bacterium]|nr:hypothetical protein [Verrucomicrobiota bacterium]